MSSMRHNEVKRLTLQTYDKIWRKEWMGPESNLDLHNSTDIWISSYCMTTSQLDKKNNKTIILHQY